MRRSLTIQLNAASSDLLEAVMSAYSKSKTPNRVAQSCFEEGLVRLAVLCSRSADPDIAVNCRKALRQINRQKVNAAIAKP